MLKSTFLSQTLNFKKLDWFFGIPFFKLYLQEVIYYNCNNSVVIAFKDLKIFFDLSYWRCIFTLEDNNNIHIL